MLTDLFFELITGFDDFLYDGSVAVMLIFGDFGVSGLPVVSKVPIDLCLDITESLFDVFATALQL